MRGLLRRRGLCLRELARDGSEWHVVMGLGNPGRKYRGTRHNMGFRVVEELARRVGAGKAIRACEAHLRIGPVCNAHARTNPCRLILATPLTYVNRSGVTASGLLREMALEPQRLFVVVDDVELDFGRLRLRRKGGGGGHRGILSIAEAIGSEDFPRLRVGVGAEVREGETRADFVLGEFDAAERTRLDSIICLAAEAVEMVFSDGIEAAMSRFNR